MMEPKKYEELMQQEDYFREKYGCIISLDLTTAFDNQHFTGKEIHGAVMTVTGETYAVRDSPVFRSDDNGAFYRQVDAMLNARIKLVDWFKEMEAKGFMSYEEEYAYITSSALDDERLRVVVSEAESYIGWLLMRRRQFEEIQ